MSDDDKGELVIYALVLNIFSIYDKSIPLGSISVLESLSYTIAL